MDVDNIESMLYRPALNAYNSARRLVGSKWINTRLFNIETPDDNLNRMFKCFTTEAEERLSLPFGLKLRSRWLESSESKSGASVLESSLSSELIALFNVPVAAEILQPFILNQSDDGNIPMEVRPFSTSSFSAGPYLFNAFWRIHQLDPSRNPGSICDAMSRLIDWLVMHKKSVEGLYTHADSAWFNSAPCLIELRRAHPHVPKIREDVRSVAFNSLIAMQSRVMARIARVAERERDAKRFEEISDNLAARVHEMLWDEENGFYYDLVGDTVTREISLAGFLPMVAEIPSRKQAARMTEWLPFLSDRRALLSQCPDAAPMFRLVTEGLLKYGFVVEAAEIALAVAQYCANLPHARKYYLPRVVALLHLIDTVAGFNKFSDRYVLFPKMPRAWAGNPLRIFDGDKNYNVKMTLGQDDFVSCVVTDSSGADFEYRVRNNSAVVLKFPLEKQGN